MASPKPFVLKPGTLTLDELAELGRAARPIALDKTAWGVIDASAATVATIIAEGRTAYGITTGFGSLAHTRISAGELAELQRRLVLSHAAGTGPLLDDELVRLAMIIKVNTLARGHSGVRRIVIETLLSLINAGACPCVPAKGSVGASGDLAPLAHIAAAMIGVGELRLEGKIYPAEQGLSKVGLEPIALAAKEGLALLNGSQVSTALAAAGLARSRAVFAAALVAGSLSLDATAGSDTPFDPRIHAIRGQPGQIRAAAILSRLIANSEIRRSHIDCDRVQDPYSLRCQPQVMGAILDHLDFAAGVIEREANAVSDNPLVFPATNEVLSGGNFHAEPVAMAADVIAIAIAEIGAISERRIALLTDARMSGLPAFLVAKPGLNSGFMIAQVTAAALASENKCLAHPASVDSLPTSANQEDHVSMATHGARRLLEMAENSAGIVAIELLAAAQGIDFRRPLKSSPILERAMTLIRAKVPTYDEDRFFAPDIAAAKELVAAGTFRALAGI